MSAFSAWRRNEESGRQLLAAPPIPAWRALSAALDIAADRPTEKCPHGGALRHKEGPAQKNDSAGQILDDHPFPTSVAASSINFATSLGRDISEAWLAASVTILRAPIRDDIRCWFSGAIIRSSLDI